MAQGPDQEVVHSVNGCDRHVERIDVGLGRKGGQRLKASSEVCRRVGHVEERNARDIGKPPRRRGRIPSRGLVEHNL